MINNQNQPADFSNFPCRANAKTLTQKQSNLPNNKKTLKKQLVLLVILILILILIIISVYFSKKEKIYKDGEYEPPINYKLAPGEIYQLPFP